jgi:predicted transglutaminase-like cysteine proteinase
MLYRHAYSAALLLISTSAEESIAADRPAIILDHSTDQVAAPNVFGSVSVPIAHSRYDARWQRVLHQSRSPHLSVLVQQAASLAPDQKVRFVNASLNRAIRYQFDTDPAGDRWATATETMKRRAGDCEDIVIAKLQALRTLGVPASDLYMTILLVRLADRFWVLDNRSDRMVTQEEFGDFRPILTFSGASTWTHGYRLGTQAPRSIMIAMNDAKLPIGSTMRSASSSGTRR